MKLTFILVLFALAVSVAARPLPEHGDHTIVLREAEAEAEWKKGPGKPGKREAEAEWKKGPGKPGKREAEAEWKKGPGKPGKREAEAEWI
jgi:hypothetical protein